MSSSNQSRTNKSPARNIASAGLAALTIIAFASVPANAQTSIATTTTIWGGTVDWTQFGLASMTAPTSGIILTGTATSTITKHPVRHMWVGDAGFGLCRLDPEVDDLTGITVPNFVSKPGIGVHQVNNSTCIGSIQASAFVPGQIAFDGSTNTLYAPAIGRVNAGIIRLHYDPAGDSGNGTLDPFTVRSLIGTQSGRNAAGGCPQVIDPKTNSPVPIVPDATAIGPDGNLYVGNIRDGAVLRIKSPATFDPSTDCPNNGASNVTPGPNDKIQIPIMSSDERFGAGHTFGMGWVGHTLVGNDNIAPWVLFNADLCLTPTNGNRACTAPAFGGGGAVPMPTEILAAFAGAPQAAGVSDAQYPSFGGNTYFAANFPSVTKVSNITSLTAASAAPNYGGSFNFITGLTADPLDLTNKTLYVSSDSTQGSISGAASIFLVSEIPPAPGPPLAPDPVNAASASTANATTGSVAVSWTPLSNGQPIDHYIVRTFDAPAAPGTPPKQDLTIPDVTVSPLANGAVPTSVTVSGLSFGIAYEFAVEACNGTLCSAFSAFSNAVTPEPITAPPAPTNVTAIGGDSQAAVAWTQATNGGSPITSSTITATDVTTTPAVAVSPSTVIVGSATGGTVLGLTNSHCYTFTVSATNTVGSGPSSGPFQPPTGICLAVPTGVDMAISMTSPASVNPGSNVTFTMTVNNHGPASAAQVILTDNLTAPLISSSTSPSTSQGACVIAGSLLTCNLGAMAAGAQATVAVTVGTAGATGSVSNTASVSMKDSLGNAVADIAPANNTASSTTTINTNPGTTAVTTDLQVTGASNNGNPVHGSNVTYTWQIKNNLGTVNVSDVTFANALPSTFTQVTVGTTQGSCKSAPGTLGGTISCDLGPINGGQTAIVTVTVSPTVSGTGFVATGSVPATTAVYNDSNPANNSFSVIIGAQ